jgi:hypothetical protein
MRTIPLSISILALFSVFFTGFAGISYGQSIPTAQEPLEIELSNDTPSPYAEIIVRVKSFSLNINSATITWFLNGTMVEKGIGLVEKTIKVEGPGSVNKIGVVVSIDGRQMQKEVIVKPTEISLVWEADGYVPPFYKGKAPFVRQGLLTITAIPSFKDSSGRGINPKDLVYKWTENSVVLNTQSGYGKDSVRVLGGIIERPIDIRVEITSVDGKTHGRASMKIDPHPSDIVVYEDNPLYGTLYNKAVHGQYKLNKNEISLVSIPYFFSKRSIKEGAVSYTWMVNDYENPNLDNATKLTLRKSGRDEGTSYVSVTAQNKKEIFQSSETQFSVIFEKNKDTEQ